MRSFILLVVFLSFTAQSHETISRADIGEFYIEYQSKGDSDFVILLETGSGGDLHRWDNIFDDLANLGHTIRYTRVGNENPSQLKRQFSAEEYSAHLDAFLTTLNISKPIVVISHSYGALITRMFAANFPERVAGMLLIDPNTEADNDIMRSINLEEANREIAGWIEQGSKNGMANDFLDFWARRHMPGYPQIKDIPVTVLISSKKYEPTPHIFFTDEGRAKKAKWHKDWVSNFPQGKAIVTTQSGHSIDLTEPELVFNELKIIINTLKMSLQQ
ncbi:alpha/beta hydrolase [uncultured Paraglaciecola sp.]|uniref:alpha/beta fold hydrolase n=1 Tax=uncultured Paraglaciecola sp. TaxID=1765024 RepID=UPI0030DBB6D6|tara:strand:- start:205641 stop:206462 length:822 start_codon:yes stop_codon:yes gene_type:complete